jgi:hypothetical protein
VKAKVHASRTKQMVIAFFDSKRMVYTNYVPRGKTLNANYVIRTLQKFLKALKAKRPELVPGECFLHWNPKSDPVASFPPPPLLTWHQQTSSCS